MCRTGEGQVRRSAPPKGGGRALHQKPAEVDRVRPRHSRSALEGGWERTGTTIRSSLCLLVGAGGFEPPTSRTRTVRSSRTEPRPEAGRQAGEPYDREIIPHMRSGGKEKESNTDFGSPQWTSEGGVLAPENACGAARLALVDRKHHAEQAPGALLALGLSGRKDAARYCQEIIRDGDNTPDCVEAAWLALDLLDGRRVEGDPA